ncbi:TIGR04255 family protein [Rhizobium leguminosarum bv. trifolii]|nr:TIGR04255 family protein [Rhizobium leguminosarum bv. trifolii]
MFAPLHADHSISELIFFFEFQKSLQPASLDALIANHGEVAADLPGREDMNGIQFEQGPDGFHQSTIQGEEWKRYKPDGSVDWVARIGADAVSLHALQYEGWSGTWGKARKLLQGILRGVSFKENLPRSVGLRYLDRFIYKPTNKNYDLSVLFQPGSPYIPANIIKVADNKWHTTSGWVSLMPGRGNNVLQQLNIDAITQANGVPSVSILHSIVVRLDEGNDPSVMEPNSTTGAYSDFISDAKNCNHALLQELLTAPILQRIGLGKNT